MGICYSLKEHIKGLDQSHMEPDPRQQPTQPRHAALGPGSVTREAMASFRKKHPAAWAEVHGPIGCCVTLLF